MEIQRCCLLPGSTDPSVTRIGTGAWVCGSAAYPRAARGRATSAGRIPVAAADQRRRHHPDPISMPPDSWDGYTLSARIAVRGRTRARTSFRLSSACSPSPPVVVRLGRRGPTPRGQARSVLRITRAAAPSATSVMSSMPARTAMSVATMARAGRGTHPVAAGIPCREAARDRRPAAPREDSGACKAPPLAPASPRDPLISSAPRVIGAMSAASRCNAPRCGCSVAVVSGDARACPCRVQCVRRSPRARVAPH